MNTEVTAVVEATARLWSGVAPPNVAAIAMAATLAQVMEGFEGLRGQLVFEDEPATFLAALQAIKEGAQ
jgi:hypothetical protein